jgi:hypothetical protein
MIVINSLAFLFITNFIMDVTFQNELKNMDNEYLENIAIDDIHAISRNSPNQTAYTWNLVDDGNAPSSRYYHKMTYDNKRELIYLYGGYDDTNYLGDLWKYDLILNKWSEITDINPPHARAPDGLIYDSTNDVLYMYGGFYWENSNGYRLTDLWKYDINNYIWTKLNDGTAIVNRSASKIVFDEYSGEIYMFGGISENVPKNFHGDFWKYDISGNSWNEINTESTPENRSSFGMIFNKKNSNIYLYGGDAYQTQLDDLWCFNTTTQKWYEIDDKNSFGVRSSFSMLYREANDELFIFGGGGAVLKENDLWRFYFTNDTWFEVKCQNKPERRVDLDMIYDERYDKLFLFGGNPNYGDLWKFEFNRPPYLSAVIPDIYEMTEDEITTGDNLIDLEFYFEDDYDDGNLTFEMIYEEDNNLVDAVIDGRYIDFIQKVPDWWGTLKFQVKAIDNGGDGIPSNNDDKSMNSGIFEVTVKPLNDKPILNHIDGDSIINNHIEFNLVEDVWFNATIDVFDPDSDTVTFSTNLTIKNFNLDKNTGTISFLPSNENVGNLYCNISVDDGEGSSNYSNILFKIQNFNDPPFDLKIKSPAPNSEWKTSNLIDFIGSCDDPDLHIPESSEELSYEWSSNIIGKFGSNLEMHNLQLSKGKHTITLKVTDIEGESLSTSIEINIIDDGAVIVQDPPFVTLGAPINNKIINTTLIMLSWTTSFSKPNDLTYDVFIDTNAKPVKLKSSRQTGTSFLIEDLENNLTYYWTVIPYFGNLKGNCSSGVWSFSILKEYEDFFEFSIQGPDKIVMYQGEEKNEIHINKSESKDVKLFLDINKDTPVNLYKLEIKASSNSGLEKNITINLIIKEQMINSNESSGNNTNLLIIMGFIVIIIVIFLLVFLFLFKRKKRNEDGPKEIPQNIIKRESGPKGPE